MSITIEGIDNVLAAFDALDAQFETGAQNAVAEAVDGTYDESQRRVPYDAVTKHPSGYVHLRDSGEKEIGELEGSVSYGTDHCLFIEFGTSKMPPQPYLGPGFEVGRQTLLKACKELTK